LMIRTGATCSVVNNTLRNESPPSVGVHESPEAHGAAWHPPSLAKVGGSCERRGGATNNVPPVLAPDLAEDRWDRAIFSRGRTGLALGIALLCLTLGVWPGLIIASTHAAL
jgi:hypothetical protein